MASPKKQRVRFLLKRRGQFGCKVTDVTGHCAMQAGPLVLQYTVEIECYHLDNRRFVYAQEDIDKLFLELTERAGIDFSCEAIASECALELRSRVIMELDTPDIRVSVEISPPPYVGSATASIGEAK